MGWVTVVSTYNKVKGTRFETDLEDWLNGQALQARRLPRAGNRDIGDVAVVIGAGKTIVIEAKNCKTQQMAKWLEEAAVESANFDNKYHGESVGVVVVKARQKPIGEARVTMTLETLVELVRLLS